MNSYLSNLSRVILLSLTLHICPGCVTTPTVSLTEATRVLGVAVIYKSASGERLEIIHDDGAGVIILKLPDETITVLPAEYEGSEGRYKNSLVTVWERDNSVLLWIDGKVAFVGSIEKK